MLSDENESFISLSEANGLRLIMRGTLQCPGLLNKQSNVQTGLIVDWGIQFGGQPCVWVQTSKAWYKLLSPAPSYMEVWRTEQRRLNMCTRAAAALKASPRVSVDEGLGAMTGSTASSVGVSVPRDVFEGATSVSYSIQEVLEDAKFLFLQLSAMVQQVPGLLPSLESPLMQYLKQLAAKQPEAVPSTGSKDIRQRSLRRVGTHEDTNLVQLSSKGDRRDEKVSSHSSIVVPSAAVQRSKAERMAEELRGEPPAPCQDWLLEEELVPEVLMVWEVCMAFSYIFGLPPMSFRALEAALCPLPPSHTWSQELVPTPVTSSTLNLLIDPAASASSVLLRDLHHGLIRVADGWNPKYLRPAPDTAQQSPEEPKAQLWQERLWMCILAPAHVCHVESEATEAALMLQTREYAELSVRQRISLLRSLVNIVLDTDLVRYNIASKIESLANPQLRMAAALQSSEDMTAMNVDAPYEVEAGIISGGAATVPGKLAGVIHHPRPPPQWKKRGRPFRGEDENAAAGLMSDDDDSDGMDSDEDERQGGKAGQQRKKQSKGAKKSGVQKAVKEAKSVKLQMRGQQTILAKGALDAASGASCADQKQGEASNITDESQVRQQKGAPCASTSSAPRPQGNGDMDNQEGKEDVGGHVQILGIKDEMEGIAYSGSEAAESRRPRLMNGGGHENKVAKTSVPVGDTVWALDMLPDSVDVEDVEDAARLWVRWMDTHRLGARKHLGADMRRRRYWALGCYAGCWRVYVEWEEGRRWGWYEGASLVALRTWLKQGGGGARETALLRCLSNCPLGPAAAGNIKHRKATLCLPSKRLADSRPDGYRSLFAPYLRGEANRVVPGGSNQVPSLIQRVEACCEALLGEIDFWREQMSSATTAPSPEEALVSQGCMTSMVQILEGVRATVSGARMAEYLLQLEQILTQCNKTCMMWTEAREGLRPTLSSMLIPSSINDTVPEGSSVAPSGTSLRDVWKLLLSSPGPKQLSDLALLLIVLQQHVVPAVGGLTRQVFIRELKESRCPLFIPQTSLEGTKVALLRSALLAHIAKHSRLAKICDVSELTILAVKMEKARAVRIYRVVAVTYRSYPSTRFKTITVKRDQSQQEDGPQTRDDEIAVKESNKRVEDGDVEEDEDDRDGDRDRERAGQSSSEEEGPDEAALDADGRAATEVPGSGKEGPESAATDAAAGPSDIFLSSSAPNLSGAAAASMALAASARPCCAWVLLQAVDDARSAEEEHLQVLALPVHIDSTLPDFLIPEEIYMKSFMNQRKWKAGDRLRSCPKPGSRSLTTLRGTVRGVKMLLQPGGQEFEFSQDVQSCTAHQEEGAAVPWWDPWEALAVEWDIKDAKPGTVSRVSPWEVEVDAEEDERMAREEERRIRREQYEAREEALRLQREEQARIRQEKRWARDQAAREQREMEKQAREEVRQLGGGEPLEAGGNARKQGGRSKRRKVSIEEEEGDMEASWQGNLLAPIPWDFAGPSAGLDLLAGMPPLQFSDPLLPDSMWGGFTQQAYPMAAQGMQASGRAARKRTPKVQWGDSILTAPRGNEGLLTGGADVPNDDTLKDERDGVLLNSMMNLDSTTLSALSMPHQQYNTLNLVDSGQLQLGSSAGAAPLPWLLGASMGLMPGAAAAAAGGTGVLLMGAASGYSGAQQVEPGPQSQWVDFGPEGGLVLIQKPEAAMLQTSTAVVPGVSPPLSDGLQPGNSETVVGRKLL
ncbi:hypothetical protein CEUSTIGMA_g1512.t1 [Chlamydomonas eustigma]|uniref:Uncharacterized protein n=1 Tax=Chlamydomonas eustigma TaxID=1157962 RepID=A0A250WTV3_9CHLO|nr:hypothetical protein CEUSTIGMA_g1512.t1 [Chlamydomonas eustigma]|eukprot:GAX74062.1 hypothetical protein CEUSTIGMA_g1512.t1 [Chlamydomonas eustigma]